MDLTPMRQADRRLAVVGSRALAGHRWNHTIIEAWVIQGLNDALSAGAHPIGISGGAAGIDREFEAFWRNYHDLPFLPIPPMIGGTMGYFDRDKWIAWLCTDLLCVDAEVSATGGAAKTAGYATTFGRRVTHVRIPAYGGCAQILQSARGFTLPALPELV